MAHPDPQRSVIFRCAWLYYVHGTKQDDIAKSLGVSRASVALYLRKARELGLVRVSLDSEEFADGFAAKALRDGLGLSTVHVVPPQGSCTIQDVAAAAWYVLEPSLKATRHLGVAWGETLYAFADLLPRAHYPDLKILQLCGNMGGTPFGTLPDTSTFRIARQLGAEPHNLYAPMILSSDRVAAALKKEPVIAQHLSALHDCEVALFSPGSCAVDSHIVTSGGITETEVRNLRENGARAVLCGHFIDEDGNALSHFNKRVVAVDIDVLHSIPEKILIASGIEKAEAVAAALRGGFVSKLVVDMPIANYLVKMLGLTVPGHHQTAQQAN